MTIQRTIADKAAMAIDPKSLMSGLIAGEELAAGLGLRRDSLSRLANDPKRKFPRGLRIGCATFYNLDAVRRWIEKQTDAADSDED